jgi:hypothetical protein
MTINVDAALKALRAMTVAELRTRYTEVFREPTRSFNKAHLVKRIIWRMQANAEGGLSERARRRAMELANDADLRLGPPKTPTITNEPVTSVFRVQPDDRLPMPGTLLKRDYKGRTLHVRVLANGFEFEGEVYRSLSAIARKITGSHWNGYLFFGLTKPSEAQA